MKLIGKTSDNKPVFDGIGKLCFTQGIPLEIILGYFHDNKLTVDWADYIFEAFKDGHNPRTIKSKIESAVFDIYGQSYSTEIMDRANKIIDILIAQSTGKI